MPQERNPAKKKEKDMTYLDVIGGEKSNKAKKPEDGGKAKME